MAFPSSKLKKGNFTRKDFFSKCLFNTIFFFFTLYQKKHFYDEGIRTRDTTTVHYTLYSVHRPNKKVIPTLLRHCFRWKASRSVRETKVLPFSAPSFSLAVSSEAGFSLAVNSRLGFLLAVGITAVFSLASITDAAFSLAKISRIGFSFDTIFKTDF